MSYTHLIGRPFELGARGPDKFDCYGLCLHILKERGHQVPDYTSPEAGTEIAALISSQLEIWRPCGPKVGAVVVFKVPGSMHCGLVVGPGKFIHAWRHAGGVCIERLDLWARRLIGFYEYRTA